MHECPVDKQGWKDVGKVAAKSQELFLAKEKDVRGAQNSSVKWVPVFFHFCQSGHGHVFRHF